MARKPREMAASDQDLERGERFLSAYNVIEQAMERKLGDSGSKEGFRRLVDHLSGRDGTVTRFREDLIEFAELRNAIVHERISPRYLIAVPLQGTVDRIETIAEAMERPLLVYPKFRRDVVGFSAQDTMRDVLGVLVRTGYSQFPVFREHSYLGLLTDGGIARWLARHLIGGWREGVADPLDLTVEEALKVEKNPDRARFIPRTTTVWEAGGLFALSGDKWRVSALFITENGNPGERLLGIITPYDIPSLEDQ